MYQSRVALYGIEFGVQLKLMEEPNKLVFLSTVRQWSLKTTVQRYHFLCRLDSIFRKFFKIAIQRPTKTEEEKQKRKEDTGELDLAAAVEDAKRKTRNCKKT